MSASLRQLAFRASASRPPRFFVPSASKARPTKYSRSSSWVAVYDCPLSFCLNATIDVSPQSTASVGAARPLAAAASSHLAARPFNFAESAGLAEAAQRSFLWQTEDVFKGVNPR